MPQELEQNLVRLAATRIDEKDDTYALSPDWETSPSLTDSVRSLGLLSPLLLQPSGRERYRIVDGFRRYRAAVQAGLSVLPALVLKSAGEEPQLQLFLAALHSRLASRPASEVEKALILEKLKKTFRLQDQQLVEEFLPRLGIRGGAVLLKRYLQVAGLPRPLLRGLPPLEIETALRIAAWSPLDQKFFLSRVIAYRLGRNHQKELFELLDELAAASRQRGGPGEISLIWKASGAGDIDSSSGRSRPQRLQLILEALRQQRYPLLARQRKRAGRLLAELDLPSEIQCRLPPFFEGDSILLSLRCRSPRQLERLARRLEKASVSRALRGLFELL